MNHQATAPQDLDRFLECFGSFNAENKVCLQSCSLNLRCAIEKEEQMRMELLEEITTPDGATLKVQ